MGIFWGWFRIDENAVGRDDAGADLLCLHQRELSVAQLIVVPVNFAQCMSHPPGAWPLLEEEGTVNVLVVPVEAIQLFVLKQIDSGAVAFDLLPFQQSRDLVNRLGALVGNVLRFEHDIVEKGIELLKMRLTEFRPITIIY